MEDLGGSSMALGDYSKSAEWLYRQVLQIRLSSLGPKNAKTIYAISKLSAGMALRLNPTGELPFFDKATAKSCVQLARSALQIHTENAEWLSNNGQELVFVLLFVLGYVGEAADAIKLGEMEVTRNTQVLGESHPTTLRYHAGLASSYRREGRLEEAVTSMRRILSLQTQDHSLQDTYESWNELSKSWRGLRRYREALVYQEQLVPGYTLMMGPLDAEIKLMWCGLGDSFVQTGQVDRALELYSEYFEKVREAGAQDHPFVKEVEGWIAMAENALPVV